MKKFGAFIKKHKVLTVLVILVLILGIVFFVAQGKVRTALQQASVPQTTTLEKTSIEQLVTATGKLQSSKTQNVITLLAGYLVHEVYVEEGNAVTEGKILMQLDTTDIDRSIADMQSQLANANLNKATAIAQAERKVTDAQNQYNIDKTQHDKNVADAQSALDAAKAAVNADAGVQGAKAALDSANLALATAQASHAAANPADANYADLQQAVATAQATQSSAEAAYNSAYALAYSTAAAPMELKLETAKTTRDTVLRQDSLSIEAYKDALTNTKNTDTAATLRSQLATYKATKEKCTIKAGISGTVTALSAKAGEVANSAAPLAVIQDLAHLEATATVPDYDMLTLKKGLDATITSEAAQALSCAGKLTKIGAVAQADGSFAVTVTLTGSIGNLHVGQEVTLNIRVGGKDNIFAVPYDAVTTNAAGEKVVYALDDATAPQADGTSGTVTKEIVVTTGMEGDYLIEITSPELIQGMQILTDPQGKNVAMSLQDMQMMMMGGGRADTAAAAG